MCAEALYRQCRLIADRLAADGHHVLCIKSPTRTVENTCRRSLASATGG